MPSKAVKSAVGPLEVEYFALIIGYRLATIDILIVGVSRDEIAPKC